MLDSFEKESRLQERRAARQRQMQIMEEAASGVSLPLDESNDGVYGGYRDDITSGYKDEPMGGSPGSGLELGATGGYDVNEDSEDDVPSMYSGYSGTKATAKSQVSSSLWGSGTQKDLSEDKLKFVMGDGDDNRQHSSASWRARPSKEYDESRQLIMLAGRRVSSGNALEFEYDEPNERRKYNHFNGWFVRNKKFIYSFGALLAVALIVMGVSIGEKNKNTNHDRAEWPPKQNSAGSETLSSSEYNPDQSPMNPPASQEIKADKDMDQQKFNRIKDRILEHQISHASTLEDPTSPQYKALTWIVRDDPRQLDVALIDDEASGVSGAQLDKEEALFERYALVVFWYTTTDLSAVNSKRNGRKLQEEGVDDYTQSDIQWTKSTDWLSASGFCQWHGIVCHPDVMSSNPNSHFNDDFHVAILNLTDNNIHGEVPREMFVALNKMQALDLSGNGLGGSIGTEIGELKELQDLFLQSNQFTGNIPTAIGEMESLYNLNMSDNRIKGTIPTQIGKLRRLRDCSLFNNRIKGRIPDEIGDLTDLLALYLDSNELSGKIPKQTGLLTSLVDLRLRANKFTGTIPTELGALTNLETIYLDTNSGITGKIPKEFGNFIKATEIQLYQNSLSGTLPSELGLLDGLVYLYLDSNELTGSIPEEWGGMRNLEQLFVSGNNLKGEIPATIRGMEKLQYLRANDNQFSGTIPTDMGKLLKMEYLYLEENDLDGPVPLELGELYKLKLMHLDGNNLHGQMPAEICTLKTNFFLLDLTAANNEDLSCACCTDK